MGYRSDVRIITSKKGYKELNKFVNKYISKQEDQFNLLDSLDFKEENKYEVYFGWDWIKWYEGSYPSVDAIMEGLSDLENKDYSYRYARLGENYDDYEEMSYDSEREEEQDLEYPSLLRTFDDDYILSCMKSNNIDIDLTID